MAGSGNLDVVGLLMVTNELSTFQHGMLINVDPGEPCGSSSGSLLQPTVKTQFRRK